MAVCRSRFHPLVSELQCGGVCFLLRLDAGPEQSHEVTKSVLFDWILRVGLQEVDGRGLGPSGCTGASAE